MKRQRSKKSRLKEVLLRCLADLEDSNLEHSDSWDVLEQLITIGELNPIQGFSTIQRPDPIEGSRPKDRVRFYRNNADLIPAQIKRKIEKDAWVDIVAIDPNAPDEFDVADDSDALDQPDAPRTLSVVIYVGPRANDTAIKSAINDAMLWRDRLQDWSGATLSKQLIQAQKGRSHQQFADHLNDIVFWWLVAAVEREQKNILDKTDAWAFSVLLEELMKNVALKILLKMHFRPSEAKKKIQKGLEYIRQCNPSFDDAAPYFKDFPFSKDTIAHKLRRARLPRKRGRTM